MKLERLDICLDDVALFVSTCFSPYCLPWPERLLTRECLGTGTETGSDDWFWSRSRSQAHYISPFNSQQAGLWGRLSERQGEEDPARGVLQTVRGLPVYFIPGSTVTERGG